MRTRPYAPTPNRADALADRYVHAVTQRLPEELRGDVADELRGSIGDRVESLLAGRPELGEAGAERVALEELGDPALLADGYRGTRHQLIGPEVYPAYVCVLRAVLVTVVPVVAVVVAVVQALTGSSVGAAVGETVWTALSTAVHIAFWVTVVFALVERGSASQEVRDTLGTDWSPDKLPELPRSTGGSMSDLVASAVFLTLIGAAIVWQQLRPPVRDGSDRHPVLDPELWSFWLPLVLVLLLVELAFEVVKFQRGWSPRVAAVNTVLAVVFAAPLVYLAASARLLNPAAVAAIRDQWSGFDPSVAHTVVVMSALVIGVWDSVDGWVKARTAGTE